MRLVSLGGDAIYNSSSFEFSAALAFSLVLLSLHASLASLIASSQYSCRSPFVVPKSSRFVGTNVNKGDAIKT